MTFVTPTPDQVLEARRAATALFEKGLAHARSAAIDQADRHPQDRSSIAVAAHDRWHQAWRTALTDEVFASLARATPGLIVERREQPGLIGTDREIWYLLRFGG